MWPDQPRLLASSPPRLLAPSPPRLPPPRTPPLAHRSHARRGPICTHTHCTRSRVSRSHCAAPFLVSRSDGGEEAIGFILHTHLHLLHFTTPAPYPTTPPPPPVHAAHTRTKLHTSLTVDSREAAYSGAEREEAWPLLASASSSTPTFTSSTSPPRRPTPLRHTPTDARRGHAHQAAHSFFSSRLPSRVSSRSQT